MVAAASLVTLLVQFRACQYTALAGATVWAWDILITFDEELELLWSSHGSVIKTLYLINRYHAALGVFLFLFGIVPPTHDPRSKAFCRWTWSFLILCQIIQVVVSSTIFVMRLCALYCMQPRIKRFLAVCLIISNICLLGFFGAFLKTLLPGTLWESFVGVCILPAYNTWSVAGMYLTPVFIDSVVYIATINHAIQFARGEIGIKGSPTGALLRRLYMEGSLYYLLIIHIRMGSVIVFFVAPIGLQVLFCYLAYTVSSTLTSRWFLSFRRKVHDSQRGVDVGAFDTSLSRTDWRITLPHRRSNPNPESSRDVRSPLENGDQEMQQNTTSSRTKDSHGVEEFQMVDGVIPLTQ